MSTPTEQLLVLIIEQKLNLAQYAEKLPPLINEKFEITSKEGLHYKLQIDAAKDLVDAVIYWEDHMMYESLQSLINRKYSVRARIAKPVIKGDGK